MWTREFDMIGYIDFSLSSSQSRLQLSLPQQNQESNAAQSTKQNSQLADDEETPHFDVKEST